MRGFLYTYSPHVKLFRRKKNQNGFDFCGSPVLVRWYLQGSNATGKPFSIRTLSAVALGRQDRHHTFF
jgi:hypothetical protein